MLCPRCNTENDAKNVFCANCGQPFQQEVKAQTVLSPRAYFLLMTIRFFIGLFGLWMLKEILVNLSFVKTMRIPNFPLTAVDLISAVVAILILTVLVGFAVLVGQLFPRAFPQYQGAGTVISGVVYLIMLSVLYEPLHTIISRSFTGADAATAVLVLQVIFVFTALALAIWLAILFYQLLPIWLNNIRQAMVTPPPETLKIKDK